MTRSAEILAKFLRTRRGRDLLTCALCGANAPRRFMWIVRGEGYCRSHWHDPADMRRRS